MVFKNKKGVTMITLVITIVLMLILVGTVVMNLDDTQAVTDYVNMQSDITRINEKVNIYYAQHGTLPTLNLYRDIGMIYAVRNPNDNNNYYVIDLNAIGLGELNFGINGYIQALRINKNTPIEVTDNIRDVYIINEQSHTIYYPNGITVGSQTAYCLIEEYTRQDISNYTP